MNEAWQRLYAKAELINWVYQTTGVQWRVERTGDGYYFTTKLDESNS